MVRTVESETIDLLKEINEHLRALRVLTEIQLRGPVKSELSRLASSQDRKRVWILSDGATSTSEIARRVGITKRAIQYFVQDGLKSGLLTVDKRGYPRRTIDWVPPDWKLPARGIQAEEEPEERGEV